VDKKTEYLQKIEGALDKMRVKASLAKLEARDVQGDLLKHFDALKGRLAKLRDAGDDHWEALKDGVEGAWTEFRSRYEKALGKGKGPAK
jgi:hypothetical protein